MAGKPIKTHTYTRRDGKVVRITVPENDEGDLFDAIREQLSPEAVTAIAAWLQPARTNNPDVDRQVRWFTDQLVEMLGSDNYNRTCEELGL